MISSVSSSQLCRNKSSACVKSAQHIHHVNNRGLLQLHVSGSSAAGVSSFIKQSL